MDQKLFSLFQISRTNYYEAQDTIAKYYSIGPLETGQLPFFRFQIMLQNIKKIIKEEEQRRKKAEKEAEAKAKREQKKHKAKP